MHLVKAMTRIGTCPPCKKDDQELQHSHGQPAGVYRVLRDETQGNPNPLKLTNRGVLQDSIQLSDYLLCWNCEQRFNKNGENWFLAYCWRRNQFRLVVHNAHNLVLGFEDGLPLMSLIS